VPILKDQVVTVHYTLTDSEGNTLDTTYDEEPMEFITGSDVLLPKLESEILTMAVKSKKKIVLQPGEAYGDYDAEDVQVVKREELPDDIELEIGTELLAEVDEEEEEEVSCFISKIDGDEVTLDFNHPLAGKTLFFEVELLAVRPATTEELEHGHVHGDGLDE
jgi:FKBP-type peptidyl-prolyl cis-trans isomerase SlyD